MPSGDIVRSLDRDMSDNSYYVYALKDPRKDPAQPFYVGKGTGARSHDHLVRPDDSRKGRRIQEIQSSGKKVLVTRMIDNLTDAQAVKLEAELISAFGTEDTGGILTNAVLPSGLGARRRRSVVVPQGAKERAQLGLAMLKEAVLELVKANSAGISNAEVASLLGLRSDYGGGSKDYLSYSILGVLMREGKIVRDGSTKKHVAAVQ